MRAALHSRPRKQPTSMCQKSQKVLSTVQQSETFINPRGPVKRFSIDATYGDFQGFDLYESSVYTIDGSPRRSFLKAYNREHNCSAVYHPTRIRRYDFDSGASRRVVIRGAKRLSYREPEGIKIVSGRRVYIMYISNTLTNQSCNIYKVKRWI